ncbi:Shedu anti-phage system protein SduA domain-containing protein [Hymenobacter actinosclerus]|uniref:Histidine kinase-, DNA gyrase B-, and HSP90-like ATPase n=1 Tax=Hymenobacter actinosclerus TaxID=82805 RepID=A0A1I0BFU4_9BACT|nr:Shedu anti-phage system protein SduA domain-containing protein [Hymenobacter actinosclerus]SET05758.1 Histidine kinase-, DNA gyrase B-, and HSP90-like ATPase [Hymenobacter actinosclerus]
MSTNRFKVDAKIAGLLGENYRSSEHALRELVDNAWDADSKNVWISLPLLPSPNADDFKVVFMDDGTGMTTEEVRSEYMTIARNRRERKGDNTSIGRLVKGRKGIGKFAGLFVGSTMRLETIARGKKTVLTIEKDELSKARKDIEDIDFPIEVYDCNEDDGTTIIIYNINQNLLYPNPDKLKLILIMEYGRQDNFNIYVNNEKLDVTDVKGKSFDYEEIISDLGNIHLRFVLSETSHKLRQPGISIRVGGKTVGKPTFFDIDKNNPDIPSKLLKKLYGEVEADELLDYVTADWGAVIENSRAYSALHSFASNKIENAIRDAYKNEISLAKARMQKQIHIELQRLPEYKRDYAKKALDKVINNFYSLPEQKIRALISVVLDTIEKDEYWEVIKALDKAQHSDVSSFADALNLFGLVELAMMSKQTASRLNFLSKLQQLVDDPKTEEKEIHKAIETNLWILGPEYSIMSSNVTLRTVVKRITGKNHYEGQYANNRPDLLLTQNVLGHYLLIEFKRPSHSLSRTDIAQAADYRQEITPFLTGSAIDIIVLGGKSKIDSLYDPGEKIKILTFNDVISSASSTLNWLLTQLTNNNSSYNF